MTQACRQHLDAAVEQTVELCHEVVGDVIVGGADKEADAVCLGALQFCLELLIGVVVCDDHSDQPACARDICDLSAL